jgi:hypothetical protein
MIIEGGDYKIVISKEESDWLLKNLENEEGMIETICTRGNV